MTIHYFLHVSIVTWRQYIYVCLYKYSTITICESPYKFWLFWYNLKVIPMASWKMLCFVFLFTSFLISHDARPLPSSQLSRSNENYAFIESAKHVLKEIIRRKQLLGTRYKTNRLSPGGPDPHHHWSSTLMEGCGENSKTKKHDQDSRTLFVGFWCLCDIDPLPESCNSL